MSRPQDPAARDFAFVADHAAAAVDESALLRLVADWRRGRATRSLWDAFSDVYVGVFALVLFGAMAANAVVGGQAASGPCVSGACFVARGLVPWALWAAVVGLALSVARLFGPVLASAAEGFFLLDAPVRRARFLRRRLWGVIGGALGLGALVAGLVAGLAGQEWALVAAWAAATGLAASGGMAWAASLQRSERTRPLRVAQGALAAVALVAVGVSVAVAAGSLGWAPPAWWGWTPWVLATAGAVATVVFSALADRRLDSIRRTRITSGGSLVSGMQGAMFALDFGLARDILVEREAAARGHVRPTRGRGHGLSALVWRDAQRLVRFPRPLAGLLAAAALPYATAALGLGVVGPLVGALGLLGAQIGLLGGLRVLTRSGGLARSLPFSTVGLKLASVAVPTATAVLWAAAVTPALAGSRDAVSAGPVALATAAAGLLGAVRWQTARPVDFTAPMVVTEMGALPPNLVGNLLRGFDVVVLVIAPALFGAPPVWSLALAGVVAAFLFAAPDRAGLEARAAEQKRILEAEKQATRTRVRRPAR